MTSLSVHIIVNLCDIVMNIKVENIVPDALRFFGPPCTLLKEDTFEFNKSLPFYH